MNNPSGEPFGFYTQAAVLDAIKDQPDPRPDVVDIVVQALRSREDIRKYFFLRLQNPAWGIAFHRRGLFVSSAEGDRVIRPHLLHYLFDIAASVPGVVYDVACALLPDNYYDLYHLLGAIRSLPSAQLTEVLVNALPTWLRYDDTLTRSITAEVLDTLQNTNQCGPLATLPALEVLLEAVSSANDGTALCRGDLYWFSEKSKAIAKRLLGVPVEAMTFFETMLMRAQHAEAQATGDTGRSTWAYWRAAVEDTDQDQSSDLKDSLLCLLRDLAEAVLATPYPPQQAAEIGDCVRRYIRSQHIIVVRLGLHLIRLFKHMFDSDVHRIVLDPEVYENSETQHEFFLLLRDSFINLDPTTQTSVVSIVTSGPRSERLSKIGALYAEHFGIPVKEAMRRYRECWVRDRLWMIKGFLNAQDAMLLQELVDKRGQPEHPEYTRYISSGWVGEQSPFSLEELVALAPADVVQRVAEWSPENGRVNFDAPTKEGFAGVLQEAVKAHPEGFAQVGPALVALRVASGFVSHFFAGLRDAATNGDMFPWEPVIDLCERLVSFHPSQVRATATRTRYWDDPSTAFKAMVALLQEGLRGKAGLDASLADRVLLVLLSLSHHPDPDDDADHGLGHDDPATVALNHVRPKAMEAIIHWCLYWARQQSADQLTDVRRLRADIRSLFESKLLHEQETSLSVHSLFGRFFPWLVWLDQEFSWAQVDRIFPDDNDGYFGAAFSSFIRFNAMHVNLYPQVREKYRAAIVKSHDGTLSGLDEQVLKDVVGHLLLAYALGFEELPAASLGVRSVLSDAYELMSPQVIAGATWFLGKGLRAEPRSGSTDLLASARWARVRNLMMWRLEGLATEGWPTERDDEINWYIGWIDAQSAETLATAYPLLNMMLPYLARNRHGWHELEGYLARHVGRFPEQAAALYRKLFEHATETRYIILRDETRTILETASAYGGNARGDALATIDTLARLGFFNFGDIYEAYAFGTEE